MNKKLIVGLDPDVTLNGCGIYNKETKELQYMAISFFDLYRWLIQNKEFIHTVKVEAGWLVKKSNYRNTKIQNVSDAISRKVGENHAIGKKLAEMCEDIGIDFKLSKPLLKRWKGAGGKITHEELVNLLKPLGIEMNKKTNADVRDAILICLY